MADIKLSQSGDISTENSEMIEHFVALMYDRTCPHKTVDKCREYLFTQINCLMNNGPATQDAFLKSLGGFHSQIYGRVA